MSRLSDMLRTQRFDDYRFYHQSTVNRTLHLISAVIFLGCYALLLADPALAGIVGWLAMLTRQTGHFFFEPNGYDAVNDVSIDYKEAVKVGYNQTRKIILLLVWGSAPIMLYAFPPCSGCSILPPRGSISSIISARSGSRSASAAVSFA